MIKIIKEPVYDENDRKIEEAVGLCVCGREVELGHFICSCDCGRDYNWNGSELAPRCQWGEETGEHPADILRIP